MRLNDSFLRCIVYLGWPIAGTEDELDPVGTGFLVVHDGATYIVTAAHVALRFSRDDLPFGIRLNKTADGAGKVEHIPSAKWYFHRCRRPAGLRYLSEDHYSVTPPTRRQKMKPTIKRLKGLFLEYMEAFGFWGFGMAHGLMILPNTSTLLKTR